MPGVVILNIIYLAIIYFYIIVSLLFLIPLSVIKILILLKQKTDILKKWYQLILNEIKFFGVFIILSYIVTLSVAILIYYLEWNETITEILNIPLDIMKINYELGLISLLVSSIVMILFIVSLIKEDYEPIDNIRVLNTRYHWYDNLLNEFTFWIIFFILYYFHWIGTMSIFLAIESVLIKFSRYITIAYHVENTPIVLNISWDIQLFIANFYVTVVIGFIMLFIAILCYKLTILGFHCDIQEQYDKNIVEKSSIAYLLILFVSCNLLLIFVGIFFLISILLLILRSIYNRVKSLNNLSYYVSQVKKALLNYIIPSIPYTSLFFFIYYFGGRNYAITFDNSVYLFFFYMVWYIGFEQLFISFITSFALGKKLKVFLETNNLLFVFLRLLTSIIFLVMVYFDITFFHKLYP